MRGLLSILLLFHNEFNVLYNTGARMLDSIYHMISTLIKNRIFGVKTSRFRHLLRNFIIDVITFTTSGLSISLHSVISLPDATLCDNYVYF